MTIIFPSGPTPTPGWQGTARSLHRHDLVWLAPQLPVDELQIAELHMSGVAHALVGEWLQRELPFVCARQAEGGAAGGVRLGLTRPGTGPRQRIELFVSPHAIVRSAPPPPLLEMIAHAPPNWQHDLLRLARALHEVGLNARSYGSLLTQALSGEPCLRPDSDIDLLIECRSRAEALTALSLLAAADAQMPLRLDGELRLHEGWAVAWRELGAALAAGGGTVMAKGDAAVRLVDVEDLLDGRCVPAEPGAEALASWTS